MKAKVLFEGEQFRVLATMEGDECPVEEFLAGNAGLRRMLEHVAAVGLEEVPTKWHHEASKQDKVSEFRKGDFRLFFFKGVGGDIAVCHEVVMKKRQKADKAAVERTAKKRAAYFKAVEQGNLEIVDEDE